VWEQEDSNLAVLDGSGRIVSQGFNWYMNQFETRTGRRRAEEDKAMWNGGSNGGAENFFGRGRKNKNIEVIQNLCSN